MIVIMFLKVFRNTLLVLTSVNMQKLLEKSLMELRPLSVLFIIKLSFRGWDINRRSNHVSGNSSCNCLGFLNFFCVVSISVVLSCHLSRYSLSLIFKCVRWIYLILTFLSLSSLFILIDTFFAIFDNFE